LYARHLSFGRFGDEFNRRKTPAAAMVRQAFGTAKTERKPRVGPNGAADDFGEKTGDFYRQSPLLPEAA
jgi:hypothetical protein